MQKARPEDLDENGKPKRGFKTDYGKVRLDLIPWDVVIRLAWILTQNCEDYGGKYPARNWEEGMPWSRPFSALLRHLFAWWLGEDIDPDDGTPHMDKVLTNAAFLTRYVSHPAHKETDDRPINDVRMRIALEAIKQLFLGNLAADESHKDTDNDDN